MALCAIGIFCPLGCFCDMRHLKKGRKFGRTSGQRKSLLRALAYQLVMRERLTTSEARAKELAPRIEAMVTTARSGTAAARRRLARRLPAIAVDKLARTLGPRYAERAGGYTRIIKVGPRQSDASRMAIIEFVQ